MAGAPDGRGRLGWIGSRAMKRTIGMVMALVTAGAAAPAAMADIYIYRDENGVVNATNVMPPARYKIDKVFRDNRGSSVTKSKSAPAPAPAASTPYIKTTRGTINAIPLAVTPTRAAVHEIVGEAATAFKLDKALVKAIIQTESAFNVHATSHKGARGLMQLMPETAARYGVRDIFDPEQNIWGGVRYMRDLLEMFNHELPLALAAYNAGENAVLRFGGIPPYPETRNYVEKVMKLHQQYRDG